MKKQIKRNPMPKQENTGKVYCKECTRLNIRKDKLGQNHFSCEIPHEQDTYFEHLEYISVIPSSQNRKNDCEFFIKKEELGGDKNEERN